jgi:hypothetical protein
MMKIIKLIEVYMKLNLFLKIYQMINMYYILIIFLFMKAYTSHCYHHQTMKKKMLDQLLLDIACYMNRVLSGCQISNL